MVFLSVSGPNRRTSTSTTHELLPIEPGHAMCSLLLRPQGLER